VQGACVAAFPRVYRLSNISVTVPTTDPDGAAWDAAGGAPDLLVEVFVNGTSVGATAAVQDQFSAAFPGPYGVTLNAAGSSVIVTASDEDLTVNDPAFSCAANPITAAHLRARELACTVGGNSLSYRLDPQ